MSNNETKTVSTKYAIQTGSGGFVIEITRSGLTLTQTVLTLTSPHTGNVSTAKIFASKEAANVYIAAYNAKRLPVGRHVQLAAILTR